MPPFRPAFTRRAILAGGAAILAAPLVGCSQSTVPVAGAPPAGRLRETRIGGQAITLTAQEHPLTLGGRSGATPTWLYGEELFPVLRLKRDESLEVTLQNQLSEHTSIHWHGVRVPNAMDGVPYVTQMPVKPGENFTYRFTPPGSGTYFFHPHCNTSVQLGRGLSGVLIVEDGDPQYDDDVVVVLKDWRLAEDGSFLPFLTAEGAGRSGTYGTLRTVNGMVAPEIVVPPEALVRLRLLNLDSTRVGDIGFQGADASLLAVDGNLLAPQPLENWRLGPAMRIDVAVLTPAAGGRVSLVDFFAAEPVILATFVAAGAPPRREVSEFEDRIAFSEPDLSGELRQLRLSASAVPTDYAGLAPIVLPDGSTIDLLDSLCSTSRTMWAIDGKPWPQNGHEHLPPPLLDLKRGQSVQIELVNTTPHLHPMHLHGHIFKVLSSSKLQRPLHWADTVLVMPEERVQIAFVADNPGNWMIHCHIIEHQDTGMMAWFRVT